VPEEKLRLFSELTKAGGFRSGQNRHAAGLDRQILPTPFFTRGLTGERRCHGDDLLLSAPV
jgi:hypothetical protein